MKSEVTIQDISGQISAFAPIEIYFNNQLIWSDDVDCTEMSQEETIAAIKKNLQDYEQVMKRDDIVMSITFEIVQFHHSRVYIMGVV